MVKLISSLSGARCQRILRNREIMSRGNPISAVVTYLKLLSNKGYPYIVFFDTCVSSKMTIPNPLCNVGIVACIGK